MNQFLIVMILITVCTSCIKEEAQLEPAKATDDNTPPAVVLKIEDPLASYAWHLNNTGQTTFSDAGGTAGQDIMLAPVIEQGLTGAGIKIAVSDSGTDVAHEDLTGNQLTGQHRNYLPSSSVYWRGTQPYFSGNDNHGTSVAGIISAVGWNGKGSRGVAPNSKFAAFRFLSLINNTASSMLLKNLDQMDGNFDIFNYSYGANQCSMNSEDPLVLQALQIGVTDLRNGKGAIYVQSAGNSFNEPLNQCDSDLGTALYQANTNFSDDLATPEKIVVGAVNASGVKSSYSTPGSSLWVSAPGGEDGDSLPAILTTDISGCTYGASRSSNFSLNLFNRGVSSLNLGCNYTSLMNGTSSAAPVTSGVVALMLEANPNLTWRDVKHILAMTSEVLDYDPLLNDLAHPDGNDLTPHIYDIKWVENSAGIFFSNWYGFGRINALAAVTLAQNYTYPLGAYERTLYPETLDSYYESEDLNLDIPDEDPNGITTTLDVKHNFFIESVQIVLNLEHPLPSDLGVSLISPSGTESRLLFINSNIVDVAFPENKLLMTNAFYGENSFGTWTLKILDGKNSNNGTLTNWKIVINGHKVTGDGSYPSPVTNITHFPLVNSAYNSPPMSFTASTSSDVIRYEVSIGTNPGASDIKKWTSVGLSTAGIFLEGMDLDNRTTYYYNVRAIDNLENISGVVSSPWTTEYDERQDL